MRHFNPFRNQVETLTQESQGQRPSVLTGIPIATKDVLRNEAKNPWYLSINNMSKEDWHNMYRDSTGLSVVTRLPGVTKDSRVHINPRSLDGLVGGPVGKFSGDFNPATDLIEMTVPGGKFMAPTIIGLSRRAVKTVTANTNPKLQAEVTPITPQDSTTSETQATSNLKTHTDRRNVAAGGQSISTHTRLIPPSTLIGLVLGLGGTR